jgi:predicted DNA-binding transcriptional regulator AlpA
MLFKFFATDERIPTKEICRLLGISRRTLFRVLKEINITARPKYTNIGTKNLESYLTNTIFKRNPKLVIIEMNSVLNYIVKQ